MATSDRFNVNLSLSRNFEHLQAKYVGTGHPDISKFEWAVNHHRDTMASHLGHHDFLSFAALAENESRGRVKFTIMEKMLQPCGVPPAKPEED